MPKIGTIISATLRLEDLIPAFVDVLDECKDAHSLDYSYQTTLQAGIEQRMQTVDYFESEYAMWDLQALADELQNLAPEYCYFGANEGDGSDFGFWPCIESIEDARADGDLPAGNELPDTAEGTFLHISDHGNLELYIAVDGTWKSLWGCV